ncbi:CoA transferase subunit A [Halalkalibacterium halodurans]|uniref:3-oxoadipate CoA-transferase n=1 Tax=Halalkalibacterium halodurans (strain ATCC BAA-125 / DSM 18197 / FERM 7344 / JCM 9153 / C-125) TaxID=272558 RepID=Q9KAM8_HALH5|nr:CoA transferase subunit A [Halalkalibacterium halodurans]MED4126104.1 CoA transferase subunit A [Halalkalibacterium halodurans]MED4171292.1 CoA transferase subunit A [Halalkalibacterium halodurans]BAB05978.1 3-oxoadipate CoA-transferase [Halalkalibacterium halodurans C-125]
MSKQMSKHDVLERFKDGMSIMYGGFGGIGTPPTLVKWLKESKTKNLTLIGNDAGFPTIGIGPVVCSQQAERLITSHIGSNPIAGELMQAGKLEVEFSPQGTLMERIRAGGVGLGGILIDVGMDTIVAEGKESVVVDGTSYLLEKPVRADLSLIYAKKADPFGNLVYDQSARNTNPLMAMAGRYTIAEVEELVPLGQLDPEEVVTAGAFVDGLVESEGVDWKWMWE